MKLYVVTTGSYSDYGIHSIFINKDRALECKNLLRDSNDIEEYETSDDLPFRYVTTFRIYASVCNSVLECSVLNYTEDPFATYVPKNETYVFEEYNGELKLRLTRYVSDKLILPEKIEFYENKYKKAAQDIWYIIQQKISEGYSLVEINEIIKS